MEKKTIKYTDNPSNGIVQYLQNKTTEDIISEKYAQIFVSSIRNDVKDFETSVMFGINNPVYSLFWSSENYEENKYVIFTFKYPILLTGIGLKTATINWYTSYIVSVSDNLIWDCEYEFQAGSLLSQFYYFEVFGMKPAKMIKLIPKGTSSLEIDNFAIYGIEFFGTIFFTPLKCSCQCKRRTWFTYLFLVLN